MRIALMIPCYVDLYMPHVGISVVRVLEKLGHTVDYPMRFACCGQPPFNAGCIEESRAIAANNLDLYENSEAVVVPSGSCAAMVKVFYRELFQHTPDRDRAASLADKTWEFSQFLVDRLRVTEVGARLAAKATFHDGCHGLRELGVKQAPRTLLRHVRDLELLEMDEVETCCGFGGSFSVKFPEISTAMAEVKLNSVHRTGASLIISNDPSCLMHLDGYFKHQGTNLRCMHLAEVLAAGTL